MAGLREGGNEPPGSLKARNVRACSPFKLAFDLVHIASHRYEVQLSNNTVQYDAGSLHGVTSNSVLM
ncbi:hypothetical protein ANN_10529 [Periplaneta americana]|uniref:Uncharacterized protein n=1 Tax=Periplaneta americana TaxID=6978 RepID=A0ABQ8TP94_PERAM|nr:hypothetical protein ANN_10529 [Periplaneta americana]